ncbi:cyclin-dependent kinase 4 inhibitor C-like [Mytilus edulis]|uniref:cyclin-dependent kinase 4 inhibitor C-like n=1 Tax=Mytilus edulis TaxID=6550 RepID=UPI0039EFBBA5
MESWSSRLGAAAFNGDVEDLRLCIENGANPEYRGYKGGTALMSAARQGHLDITHFLITNGCNKDASDTHGRKALHLAAYHGHLNVVRYLVENVGISPMIKTNKGETPYDSAAISEAQALRGIESFNRLIHPEGGPVDEVTVMPPRDVKEYLQTIMSNQEEDVQGSSTPTGKVVLTSILSSF